MPGKRGAGKLPDVKRERIIYLLRTTELNFADIARRVGVNEATVSHINRDVGARPSHCKPKPAA